MSFEQFAKPAVFRTVAISGATSYLASRLQPALQDVGCHVIPILRNPRDRARLIDDNDVEPAYLDEGYEALARRLEKDEVDVLINCICNYGRKGEQPSDLLTANALVPLRLYEACSSANVKLMVTIGTALPSSASLYATTKHILTDVINSATVSGTKLMTLQSEIFYGPREHDVSKLTAYVIRSIVDRRPNIELGSGRQVRDFIHVDDLCSAIIVAVGAGLAADRNIWRVDVASGETVSVRDFVETAIFVAQSNLKPEFGVRGDGAVSEIRLNDEVIRSLGWRPSYTLESGLRHVFLEEGIVSSAKM